MNLVELVNEIKEVFANVELVKSVYADDAARVWNNSDVMYASVAFDLVEAQHSTTDNGWAFTFNFYAGDRQREDITSTTTSNYNELLNILESGFNLIREDLESSVTLSDDITYTCACLKMMDVLAVVTARVTFYVSDYAC